MNDVKCLIISSTIDYSTDLICCELERRGYRYLRINRDLFDQYEIVYILDQQTMKLRIEGREYTISNKTLKSVYFRAPVFFRYSKELSLNDQLKRGQWSSFIRNLIVFDQAKWINYPVATYKAEKKMLQLQMAMKAGLKIPHTYVGNQVPSIIKDNKTYIVKALDTPVFYDEAQEMFTYSTAITGRELRDSELQEAPVIIQEYLTPKVDLRVTAVGTHLFPAKIYYNEAGIEGDWRKRDKDGLTYIPFKLPSNIEAGIHKIMDGFGLVFGGIDLALCDDEYYFIEVNPTGEWAWLVRTAGFQIHKAIADIMEVI